MQQMHDGATDQRAGSAKGPLILSIAGSALILLLPIAGFWIDAMMDASTKYALVPLLMSNPLVFLVGGLLSFRWDWRWGLVTLVVFSVAFIASALIMYNSSALPYLVIYLTAGAVGAGFGLLIRYLRRRT